MAASSRPISSRYGTAQHGEPTETVATHTLIILAIMTCHIALLKAYETMFIVVRQSLKTTPISLKSISLPPSICGFKVDECGIENNQVLQMHILCLVCLFTLRDMERDLVCLTCSMWSLAVFWQTQCSKHCYTQHHYKRGWKHLQMINRA